MSWWKRVEKSSRELGRWAGGEARLKFCWLAGMSGNGVRGGELAVMGGSPLSTASSAVELPGQQRSQELLTKATEPASKPKKKICCACPDTKRLRDECMVEHGEAACTKWIEAHKQCLRAEGFNV
ncbi:hypothetical protein Drorol1_Dr00005825 [Drosera rotundifolia]